MNNQLENSDDDSYEDMANFSAVFEDDVQEDVPRVNDEELWRTCQKELNSLEKDIWLQKEGYLREQLIQQLLTLSQDLSSLQPQLHHPPHHHQQTHLPRHLWGHQTLQWRPPSQASPTTARKTRQPERLLRWIMRRMPMN